jgi:hypothetical protein
MTIRGRDNPAVCGNMALHVPVQCATVNDTSGRRMKMSKNDEKGKKKREIGETIRRLTFGGLSESEVNEIRDEILTVMQTVELKDLLPPVKEHE